MQETKKWYESKIIVLGLAFVVGGLAYFGVLYGFVDQSALQSAQTVYPEVARGIGMIQAGQVVGGLMTIGGALLVYWRAKKTTKIISLPFIKKRLAA